MIMSGRNLKVEKATPGDVACILDWLKAESDEGGEESFWCNRDSISASLVDGDLWVIREDEKAIAYQVGSYSPHIVNVRKDKQRQGAGTLLFKASLARAIRDDVNVLTGECAPRSSLPFWEKLGFERYGDQRSGEEIKVRLVLKREFKISPDLPRAEVTIGFYPEAALHRESVAPISVHRLIGARQAGDVVQLERRAVGLTDDEPEGRDLVVRIDIDGVERCFCKAKSREARQAGIEWDQEGQAFYVDAIQPRVDRVSPAPHVQSFDLAKIVVHT